MTFLDYFVIFLIAVWFIGACIFIISRKKKGKNLCSCSTCNGCSLCKEHCENYKGENMEQKIDVAAYVWPSYTGDEPRTRIFWPKGIGEWETVKSAKALYEGHEWPRKPLWGYVNEADPEVMEMEIDEAVKHGVNVFIYDWYWYDGRPFLENCLNDGFLKAKNHDKMKFYLMWANHNATYTWDKRNTSQPFDNTIVWRGGVDEKEFKKIGKRLIEKYFHLPEYYTIDGKPVLSIYSLSTLIESLGGVKNTKKCFKWFDKELKKNGFKGIHLQYVHSENLGNNVTGVDSNNNPLVSEEKIIKKIGFSSLTHYQYVHMTDVNRNYSEIMKDVEKIWEKTAKENTIPYFPHVSVGWDNTPRYPKNTFLITKKNTPKEIEKALIKAKALAEKTGVKLITVNSWNEWTETSYLEPDDLYGYGYLDAIKKVFLK